MAIQRFGTKLRDLSILTVAALLTCSVLVGAFIVADVRHFSPMWVFLPLMSFGFLVFAFQEYRSEFRSARFIFFVSVWLVVNLATFIVVVGSFGWLYLIPALLLEQFMFYMTAYWLLGLQIPFGRHRNLHSGAERER